MTAESHIGEFLPPSSASEDEPTPAPVLRLVHSSVLPTLKDPNTSDNPELIQAENSYQLARFRVSQAAGSYACDLVASFQTEFESARGAFLAAGGQLDEAGNLI